MHKYSVLTGNPVDCVFVSCEQVGFGAGQPVDLLAYNLINSLVRLFSLRLICFCQGKISIRSRELCWFH